MKSNLKYASSLALVLLGLNLSFPLLEGIAEEPAPIKEMIVNDKVINISDEVQKEETMFIKLTVTEATQIEIKDTEEYKIEPLTDKEREELDFSGFIEPEEVKQEPIRTLEMSLKDTDEESESKDTSQKITWSLNLDVRPTAFVKMKVLTEEDFNVKATFRLKESGRELEKTLIGVRNQLLDSSSTETTETTTEPSEESSTEPSTEIPSSSESSTEPSEEPSSSEETTPTTESSAESSEETTSSEESSTEPSEETTSSSESSTEPSEEATSSEEPSTETSETSTEENINEPEKTDETTSNSEETTEVSTEQLESGSITIKSQNSLSGTQLSGGTYQLLTTEGAQVLKDTNGNDLPSTYQIEEEVEISNLPLDVEYELKEINPPINYMKVNVSKVFSLTSEKAKQDIVFENMPVITAPETGVLTTLQIILNLVVVTIGTLIGLKRRTHQSK